MSDMFFSKASVKVLSAGQGRYINTVFWFGSFTSSFSQDIRKKEKEMVIKQKKNLTGFSNTVVLLIVLTIIRKFTINFIIEKNVYYLAYDVFLMFRLKISPIILQTTLSVNGERKIYGVLKA